MSAPKSWLNIARLVAIVGGAVALAAIFDGFPVLIVVLLLVAMVMLHEFGHFFTAKLSGMKVTEYFLGFGPRLWSMRHGETEYGIKLIPAGGYVRIVGMSSAEEVAEVDEARSYRQATYPRRLLVSVAGSFMHVVMAFILLWSMFTFVGVPTRATAEVTSVSSFVGQVSPAKQAGIRPGDRFVSIDGHHFVDPEGVVSYIERRPGKTLHVVMLRKGHDILVDVRPEDRRE
ncbi:MAG: M50 family metallopeptidase, partial [Gaiellaceae bacterium]